MAANDLILLLGQQQDIGEGDTYDTSKAEAFLLPAGVGVELYATSLHYAPCNASARGLPLRHRPAGRDQPGAG